MSNFEEIAEKLEKLGLTSLQAKIYLLLAQAQKEKTLTISKLANIDRSNAYRTIVQLQEMGLVKKIWGTPNFYQALPFEETIAILLNNKKNECSTLEKMSNELIQKNRINFFTHQINSFGISSTRMSLTKRLREADLAVKALEYQFDSVFKKMSFLESMIPLEKQILASAERGVKYRVLTDLKVDFISKKLHAFIEQPNFQIKIIQEPTIHFMIYDKKLLRFAIQSDREKNVDFYDTADKGLVQVFQYYFDNTWKEAKEYDKI